MPPPTNPPESPVLLSITEAATILGRSERQVRYLIKRGELRARKKDGRWIIDRDDLPLTDAQRRKIAAARQSLLDHVEDATKAVATTQAKAGGRRFSVRDLRAFQAGEPIYRAVVAAVGEDGSAASFLRRSLDELARGCHGFHPREKQEHYRSAREHAASAVVALLLVPNPEHAPLADRIEQELLPRVTGLIRSTERSSSRSRSRFDGFGATQSIEC